MTIWHRDDQVSDSAPGGDDAAAGASLRMPPEPETRPDGGEDNEGAMLELTDALRVDTEADAAEIPGELPQDTAHQGETPEATAPDEGPRKPRLAFMGEFSAGKSTLTNMLIGASPLPMRVTATQLPPVWLAYGDAAPYCEDLDGNRRPVDLERLEDLDPRSIRVIRLFQQSEILELCDLIDMPGISDPNMPIDLWQPIANQADMVVWCTHATQAWRQSEAAAWDALDPSLRENSLLLLTRIDKILTAKDRTRVLRRVEYETAGLFAGCFPISLTQAIAAKDNREKWERSGAEAFMDALVERLHLLSTALGDALGAPMRQSLSQHETHAQPSVPADDAPRVLPRRVYASGASRPRAARPAATS